MKEKREEDLIAEGYGWDADGLLQFERPYTIPGIVGVLAFVTVFVMIWRQVISVGIGVGLLAAAWLVIGGVVLLMYRSQPKGRSGEPLQKFRNSSPNADGLEILYVDPEKKTYFKRLFVDGNVEGA